MLIVTPAQMGLIDKTTIEETGIPGIVLMENAAINVVREIVEKLKKVKSRNFFVFAGKGNNGGDAFAVARHLYNMGAGVSVYLTADKNKIKGNAKTNLDILVNMGIKLFELSGKDELKELNNRIGESDAVIDGIFGTGLKGAVRGIAVEVIDIINRKKKFTLSIDIPSGVNGGTGEVEGTCIKADKTVTFGLPKFGLILHPGCEYTGELVVADIGFPEKVIEKFDINTMHIDEKYAARLIPERRRKSNKGDYGKILVISGSKGMTGAGCLTAGAALRSGAGLVYLAVPASLVPIYGGNIMEAVVIPLEDTNRGSLSKQCLGRLDDCIKKADVAAVGPGLSTDTDIKDIVFHVIDNIDVPAVFDADALNAISSNPSVLGKLENDAVLTPHPGEMARLMGTSIEKVQSDRVGAAEEFAKKWNVYVVLKGSVTVIAYPDGKIFLNTTGNSGMATGGSGDVLTGIIAALMGQGLNAGDAATAGVYLHGLAGDRSADIKGEHSIIAGDLIKQLPNAFKTLSGNLK